VADADWTADWQTLIDRIGTHLDGSEIQFGPDPVEASHIRQYLEVLELDCQLHYDRAVAQEHGWPDVTAPYTSAWSFVFPPSWAPGWSSAYRGTGRDEQPGTGAMQREALPFAPPTTHTFGTNASYEFTRPPIVGDRVGMTGRFLLGCVPKQTRVGRGAFVTVSRQLVTQHDELVCAMEMEMYLYNPLPVSGSGR